MSRWIDRGIQYLRKYAPPFRDRRFWVVQVMVIGIAATHDVMEIKGYQPDLGMLYFLPISLFFIPLIYAALSFGFVGSIATVVWTIIITIPNWVFWHHGLDRLGVIFQMSTLVAVAIFAGHRVDRERNAWHQAETARAGLKTYAGHLVTAQEDERKRIARELHDDSIQSLSLLCRQLDNIENTCGALSPPMISELQKARNISEEVVEGLRGFAQVLRPPVLDDLGMVASIRRLALDFKARTGMKSHVKLEGEEQRLSPDVETGMFRIAQEALWNIEHHSKATDVRVTISFQDNRVKLDINDNGIGFKVPELPALLSASGHLGLLGMQERAELLNGKLEIRSGPGQGTSICVTVPMPYRLSTSEIAAI